MNSNNGELTQRGQDRRDLIGNFSRIALAGAVGAVGSNLVRNTMSDINEKKAERIEFGSESVSLRDAKFSDYSREGSEELQLPAIELDITPFLGVNGGAQLRLVMESRLEDPENGPRIYKWGDKVLDAESLFLLLDKQETQGFGARNALESGKIMLPLVPESMAPVIKKGLAAQTWQYISVPDGLNGYQTQAVISASTGYNTVEKSAAGKLELIPHFAVSSVVELDLSDSLPPSQQ